MNLKNFIKNPLGIVATVLAVIVLVVLVGTPYLIEKELNKWIVSRGPDRSQMDNVDFNPFTGWFALYNLQVETQRGQTLHIPKAYLKFSWMPLSKKRLNLEELVLEDTYLLVDNLEETGFRIAGLILKEVVGATEEEKSSSEWGVGIDRFEIRNSRVKYDTPQLVATYHIDSYELTDLQSWNKDKPVHVELQGRIDDSPIQIIAEVTPFAEQFVTKGKLKLEKMSLALISKVLGIENMTMEGQLDIDLNVESVRQQDKLIDFSADGMISLAALQLTYDDMRFADEKISWQGKIAGNKTPASGLNLSAEGSLKSAAHVASLPSQAMTLQTRDLQWQGVVNYGAHEDSKVLTMTANLEGAGVRVGDTARNLNLVDLDVFSINTIDIQGLENVSIADVMLQKLLLFSRVSGDTAEQEEAKSRLLMAENVSIKDISYKDINKLVINEITLKSFQAYIKRQKEGGLYLLDSGPVADPSKEEPEQPVGEPGSVTEPDKAAKEPEPAETPFQFSLKKFQMESDSSVRFEDQSMSEPFLLDFRITDFGLVDIDTANAAQPVQLKLIGSSGDYTQISFKGIALPFEKPLSLDIKGKINAFDMPPLSPYTGGTIGYNITSGQMDADLNMKIDKGQLNGNTELRMRNLEVARVDPEKVPEIDTQMKVPLESGLAMLRNKQDVIKLDIALEGDIENPQFSFQDAINQAIAKAMTFASVSFLKYTLQPFGTFIAVAQVASKVGKEAAKIKLDPVQFTAAEISLDETAKQYLEKVAIILSERPQLRLEVCGKAVESDRIALLAKRATIGKKSENATEPKKEAAPVEPVADEVLVDFARERAKLVKDSLVKDYDVSHDRIYLCLPAIDATPDKEPYVEMLID